MRHSTLFVLWPALLAVVSAQNSTTSAATTTASAQNVTAATATPVPAFSRSTSADYSIMTTVTMSSGGPQPSWLPEAYVILTHNIPYVSVLKALGMQAS